MSFPWGQSTLFHCEHCGEILTHQGETVGVCQCREAQTAEYAEKEARKQFVRENTLTVAEARKQRKVRRR